jgi:hypothetical protein
MSENSPTKCVESEESSSKRVKLNEDPTVKTVDTSLSGDGNDEKANLAKENSTTQGASCSVTLDELCVVCMESDSTDRPLLPNHNCSQCSKHAWKICVCCNESLLSRICPMCRGNYAPILLHVVPGTSLGFIL